MGLDAKKTIRVVLEIEIDQNLCSETHGWTQTMAALTGTLAQCYPPLTSDMTLRFAPSVFQASHNIRQIARAGAFEVLN